MSEINSHGMSRLRKSLTPKHTSVILLSDDYFRFHNPRPAFEVGEGPHVCIDEGHHNFHTADGRYKPFAELLRGDGYEVVGFAGDFTSGGLAECDLLVVANPLSAENETNWTSPHPSAFTKEEIRALMTWVRAGGRFLLIADHAPIAGAARVTTFTGQAAQITQGWEPLLIFGPEAQARISLQQTFQEGSSTARPEFSVAGWTHGAAPEWDQGRVVFLGEAARCSAQVVGTDRFPVGMNDPAAPQNAQFCLNVVRWLTGALDP